MLKLKQSELKFFFLCIIFFFITLFVPTWSVLLTTILPIVIKQTGYLNLPRYIIKSNLIILSILLIILFSVFNFYLVYYYNLLDNDNFISSFVLPSYTIIVFYLVGLCLNFEKMPFYPFNMMLINIFLIGGANTWVFLSVGKELEWKTHISELFIPSRKVHSFWSVDNLSLLNGPSLDIFSYLAVSLTGVILCYGLNNTAIPRRIKDLKRNYMLLFFLLILIAMSLYSSIALGGRTPFVVILLSFICSACLIQFEIKPLSKKKILNFLLIMSLLLLIGFGDKLLEAIIRGSIDTNVGSRITQEGLESLRYDIWMFGIENIFNYPWGGRTFTIGVAGQSFFHNIWLDQWYDAGILSALLLLGFHFVQIFFIKKFFLLNFPIILKTFVLCSIIGFLSGFVQNPVIQASYVYFGISCFFCGSLARLTQEKNQSSYLRSIISD